MGDIYLAANNGDVGGGEIMLLALAKAARSLGLRPIIVAPSSPSDVLEKSRVSGFDCVRIPASSRSSYAKNLRKWAARERPGLLWCNGLLPAAATAGQKNRVVHLHQRPRTSAQMIISRIACYQTLATVVPSFDMAGDLVGSIALPNWTEPVVCSRKVPTPNRCNLGFLGRLSVDKGICVLSAALEELEKRRPGVFTLKLAGEPIFIGGSARDEVDSCLAAVRSQVERLGWISREEFFSQIDLAVFPSVWKESFGLVVAECQSAGVPFVISDAGALPEVAGPEYPWVSKAGDPRSLADQIEHAYFADNSKLVQASSERWQREYSPEAGLSRFKSVLVSLGLLVEG